MKTIMVLVLMLPEVVYAQVHDIQRQVLNKDLPAVVREMTLASGEFDGACHEESERTQIQKGTIHAVIDSDEKNGMVLLGLNNYLCTSENGVAILRTSDGGKSWFVSAWVDGTFSEAFFLTPDHGWLITQWAVEATYPTLYEIKGSQVEAVEVSDYAMDEPVRCPFSYAWNLFFTNNKEGIVQVRCEEGLDAENGPSLMKTKDGGRTWSIWRTRPPQWFAPTEFAASNEPPVRTMFENAWLFRKNEKQEILFRSRAGVLHVLAQWQ